MIQFDNITKLYDGGQVALRNVNFAIAKGEMAFLTGHSGAGKSTLLKLIMLMERPSKGRVLINGKNTQTVTKAQIPRLRHSTGMVFQEPRLLAGYTVYENVALPLNIVGLRHQEISKRVHEALDNVGLLKRKKSLPHCLSGGEQERVGIARAIVNRPQLLLADEPTGNLDPSLSAEIMYLFEQLNKQGTSILIATHDLALIGHMKHRILTLHQGRMASTGVKICNDSK